MSLEVVLPEYYKTESYITDDMTFTHSHDKTSEVITTTG